MNLLHDEDVQTISVNGKEVIAINVPRADYNLRPVYINNNLMRGTYRRNHEGDYHCTEQMIKMMAMIVCSWSITQWMILTSRH